MTRPALPSSINSCSMVSHIPIDVGGTTNPNNVIGTCEGNADFRKWALKFTRKVHTPAYGDFEVLLHPGNTNAWSKVVGMLVEEGDYILCENFTYPSSQALWIPQGNFGAPIALDGQGIRDDALDATLTSWDVTHPGIKKPHVLYLLSVGSNPTGVTMGHERRQKVYDVCVKHGTFISLLILVLSTNHASQMLSLWKMTLISSSNILTIKSVPNRITACYQTTSS